MSRSIRFTSTNVEKTDELVTPLHAHSAHHPATTWSLQFSGGRGDLLRDLGELQA